MLIANAELPLLWLAEASRLQTQSICSLLQSEDAVEFQRCIIDLQFILLLFHVSKIVNPAFQTELERKLRGICFLRMSRFSSQFSQLTQTS